MQQVTAQDWDNLAQAGFPIYLFEPLPARMRRLMTPSHVMQIVHGAQQTQFSRESMEEARKRFKHRSHTALVSSPLENNEHLWRDIPLPSVAGPSEENLLRPKTLLEHCHNAQEYVDEFDLNDGFDNQTLNIMRVLGHKTRMLGHFQAMLYHAENNDRHGYLWTLTNMFRLLCVMTNEASLAPVVSAACSLKHASDMTKTFRTQNEAFDKAKELGLTPDQAAREVFLTPHGQYALYDHQRDEIAKSDTWKPPDFRSLIQAAGTEAGKSEMSCVLDDTSGLVVARPMILSDETRPSDYTFANTTTVQVQTESEQRDGSTSEELTRTIQSHLWLANLEMSSTIPKSMSIEPLVPREPHPDSPTMMTWNLLEDAQNAIVQGHANNDVSAMLKGVVANMHTLSKFAREAGFLPYIGHAQYIYECYLKSQITSSRPPSNCDLSTVWSLQVDLDRDLPQACSLAMQPSL